ncbi:hypothetical protein QBZ16_001351 [Prototheca wickerhamii]|uniref:Ribosomal RNA-processing protein 40 n=1 Tax=Prototheca wickerhamii TaxID=3111 RepID=A0AAD9IF82_PROWI|nr:hypothetical protein QBZ16_001351 [Prototheca wickerhamii]
MATLAMQTDAVLPAEGTVRVGGGVHQSGESLVATKAGVVRRGPSGALWVSAAQHRYIPSVNDAVVGVITQRHSENYTVDIFGPWPALLPSLAFEGVARRNRPNLKIGDVVYCRVEEAARDVDPMLTCVDATGKAAGFGPLQGGTLFSVSTQHARRLSAGPAFLGVLGRTLKFEMAVGANGRVWVNAAAEAVIALVQRLCRDTEGVPDAEAQAMAETAVGAKYLAAMR